MYYVAAFATQLGIRNPCQSIENYPELYQHIWICFLPSLEIFAWLLKNALYTCIRKREDAPPPGRVALGLLDLSHQYTCSLLLIANSILPKLHFYEGTTLQGRVMTFCPEVLLILGDIAKNALSKPKHRVSISFNQLHSKRRILRFKAGQSLETRHIHVHYGLSCSLRNLSIC